MNLSQAERESEQLLSVLGNILQRRKIVLITCFVVVLSLVFYYNETTPPLYEAVASVVFEELRDPVPDDVSQRMSWELYLFNRIEEVNSRAFAEDIAAALPQEALGWIPPPKKTSPGFDRMRSVADHIEEGIAAFPLRNSNIVRIRVRLNDARLCLLVANLSLSVLEERSGQNRKRSIASLREFVDDQLARSAAQLSVSEGELRRFKEEHGITTLDGDAREMLRRSTEAEVLYNSTLAEVDAAKQRLGAVRQAIDSQRSEFVPTVTSVAGSSMQNLREKLVSLEAQQTQLTLQKYPENHPEAVRLKAEIEQTKKSLAEEAMKMVKASDLGDPVPRIERRIEEAVTLQIDVEGLEARAKALNQTVTDYRHWLSELPAKEMELARLERERDVNQKVHLTLLERREDIRIAEAKQTPSSRVIDRPLLPVTPIEPRKMLNLGMGGVLSLIIGFGLGFILEGRAGRLGSMLEFEERTGWPVLGVVPHVRGGPVRRRRARRAEDSSANALVAVDDPESVAGEAYSMLRTRLDLLGVGTRHRSVLVTSCGPGDGKSSTLSNLAASLGAVGRPLVVVDAEFRRPTIHSVFGVDRSPGLADLLGSRHAAENGAPAAGARRAGKATASRGSEELLQRASTRGVVVLASGNQTQESSWHVSWPAMKEVLEDLKRRYEVVLVDSPPPAMVHDTIILCGMVDAVIVVVDARSYDARRLMESKVLLERAGANVIGAVLNKVNQSGTYSYGYRRDRKGTVPGPGAKGPRPA
jgi:tyrosine-protein kinase Etk/Wzc